jgi:4-hydroxybenzoate polyprenyltransferase
MQLLLYASALFTAICFFMLKSELQVAVLLPGLISILYGIPLIRMGKRRIRLRDLGIGKIFLISFVWAWVTVVLPAVEIDFQSNIKSLSLLFVYRFLFILAITLPFDVYDYSNDKLFKVRTLPQLIGKKGAIVLAILCIALSFFFLFLFAWENLFEFHVPAQEFYYLAVSYLLTALVIWQSPRVNSDLWLLGVVDGMMGLQLLLFLAFQF